MSHDVIENTFMLLKTIPRDGNNDVNLYKYMPVNIIKLCSTCGEKKVITIIDRLNEIIKDCKMYMPYPDQFNDITDSQIRFAPENIAHLAETYEMRLEDFERHVTNYNFRNNIVSFTSLTPSKLESNHMWGLYANSGNGIALGYNLTDICELYSGEIRNHGNLSSTYSS